MRLLILAVAVSSPALAEEGLRSAFGPGEQSTYVLSWLGVPAGEFQVTVGSSLMKNEHDVWPILCLAKSDIPVYRINDKYVSYWDPRLKGTVASDFWIDENDKRRREHVTLKHGEKKALVKRANVGAPLHDVWYDIGDDTVDVAGATLWLRNVPLKVGDKYARSVFTGAVAFTMRAVVEEKTKITTKKFGEREVYKVRATSEFEGQLKTRGDMVAYFSADAAQVPLRVEADFLLGLIQAELVQYEPGRDFTKG